MSVRVVITGLGVVAPNGVGLKEFTKAISGNFWSNLSSALKRQRLFMLYWRGAFDIARKNTSIFVFFTVKRV